jgi:hypothetical protein
LGEEWALYGFLTAARKARTSFCEQKEAKKL